MLMNFAGVIMNRHEKASDNASKEEDEFLSFEFDDLEESPLTVESSSLDDEEIIELVDIFEEEDVVGNSGSDEMIQLLEEDPLEERVNSGAEKEITLQLDADDNDLDLEFLKSPGGLEIPLGEDSESALGSELEDLLKVDSESIELDLDSAFRSLDEPETEKNDAAEKGSGASEGTADLDAIQDLDELDLAKEVEFEFDEEETSAQVPKEEPLKDGSADLPFEDEEEEDGVEEFVFDLDDVTETQGSFEEPEGPTDVDAQEEETGEISEAALHSVAGISPLNLDLDEVETPSPQGEPPAVINEEQLEKIVSRVVEEVVERVAREVMAGVAEKVIGEAIEALKQSLDSASK
jgi:hypothetical protein